MEFVYIRMMLNMDQEVDSKYVNTLNREHVKHCLTNALIDSKAAHI